jgi:multidrug resistance efflux pump
MEILLCSIFTVLPDYLYRHYVQGKRIGDQITIYSVWYELRWGITTCLMLAVLLITLIFYYHPSTLNAKPFFRTVPILPETVGRVARTFVKTGTEVSLGDPIIKLDSSQQDAALDSAKKRLAEVEAALVVAESDVAAASGQVEQATGALDQAVDELNTKLELQRRSPGVVAQREVERLQRAVETRRGGVNSAEATKEAAQARLTKLLPAQKASAEALLAQAQVDVDKTTIRAGTSGVVEQFTLQVGDVVNPLLRPAGVIIPREAGRSRVLAGFNQLEAQVLKPGMIAEVTCASKPLAIIPMVVVDIQDYIATGQIQASGQLIEAQQLAQPGTLLVALEPLFKGGMDGVTPGSNCIANAYTNNHDLLSSTSGMEWLFLHIVDAVSIVHALILRVQALVLPIKTLVLGGH